LDASPLPLESMSQTLGDVLVRDECQLRPSRASVYMVTGEIPPETYIELAISDLHVECRSAYRSDRVPWWRIDVAGVAQGLLAVAAGGIGMATLFVSEARLTFNRLDLAPPPLVAVGCALG